MTARKVDMTAQIAEIHALFCVATGVQLRVGIGEYNREAAWARFLNAGFTPADLLLVVKYLQRKIREGTRNIGSLRFSNLVDRLEIFEESLSMAKADERNRKPPMTPLARVLEQARPTAVAVKPEDTQITAKPIGAYIQALREAAR
jgi:hypothetical protein